MARQSKDLFTQVREQTERALALLTAEIRKRETELQELLDQAREWRDVLTRSLAPGLGSAAEKKRATKKKSAKKRSTRKSAAKRTTASRKAATGPSRKKRSPSAAKKTKTRGKRVDWDAVLASLPSTFTIEDVLKTPGGKAKGRAQIYPAINRWVNAKKARKVGTGRYNRVA